MVAVTVGVPGLPLAVLTAASMILEGTLEDLFEICDSGVWNTNGVSHILWDGISGYVFEYLNSSSEGIY